MMNLVQSKFLLCECRRLGSQNCCLSWANRDNSFFMGTFLLM